MATDLLDSLRSRIGAAHLITSCGGRGCRVDMAGVPAPHLIVGADKAFPAHRLEGPRCDRVLFLLGPAPRRLVSAPIELKSGGLNASRVADQLQCSLEFVNSVAPPSALLACRPILVHGYGAAPEAAPSSRPHEGPLPRPAAHHRDRTLQPARQPRCGAADGRRRPPIARPVPAHKIDLTP